MAERHFCNGCGRRVNDDEFQTVKVEVVSLTGARADFGLATNATVTGELCGSCVDVLGAFVGDTDEDDAEDARQRIRPRSLAVV